jgi:hypothetical protein
VSFNSWFCDVSLIFCFFFPLDLNQLEVVVAALFFQFTLYVALRLAHRGFTLGELGLVCFGGTALCLETINLTVAKVKCLFQAQG